MYDYIALVGYILRVKRIEIYLVVCNWYSATTVYIFLDKANELLFSLWEKWDTSTEGKRCWTIRKW